MGFPDIPFDILVQKLSENFSSFSKKTNYDRFKKKPAAKQVAMRLIYISCKYTSLELRSRKKIQFNMLEIGKNN